MKTKKALTYRQSGVNRMLADRFVDQLSGLRSQFAFKKDPRIQRSIGGYASLYRIGTDQWIAATTDGVGTKLKLAIESKDHTTVGEDLVAMSVNDLICVGATPLFFLDYFATSRLNPKQGLQVMQGILSGCKKAGCPLVGGETAEMPGFYQPGEYDLAGFAVGRARTQDLLPRAKLRAGDQLIGLRSSGFHSNGYSLLRKLLDQVPSEKKKKSLRRELLTPTRIYVASVLKLLKKIEVRGMAHITGSGFLNVPRIGEKWSYRLTLPAQSERPAIIQWGIEASGLSLAELAQTFNLGVGMIIAVPERSVKDTLQSLRRSGETAWHLGEVVRTPVGVSSSQVIVRDERQEVTLKY